MSETSEPKKIFGAYEVESVLGRGSMGTIYLARDRRIGRLVALKRVQIDPSRFEEQSAIDEFFERLQREAEICGSLQHPNIVTLYEAGYEDGRISFLAFEYVEGASLFDVLKKARPQRLPLDITLRIACDILAGLAFAHGKGIVHRDIKPANIMIAADGTAKLADFGIARPKESSLTIAGSLMGTPNYMPPEQIKGLPATPRSDLFSFGVMLFEMFTGQKPFAGADISTILHGIVREPTPSLLELNSELPKDYERVVHRLTAKSPAQRFESAAATLEELRNIQRMRDAHAQTSVSAVAVPPVFAEPPSGAREVEPEKLVLQQASAFTAPSSIRPSARRRVPAAVSAVVIGIMLIVASVPSAIIWRKIDPTPKEILSTAQLAEFATKRERMARAKSLFHEGKYDESLAICEAYVAKYPYATAAKAEAEKAREAMRELERGNSGSAVNVTARSSRRKHSAPEQKKPSGVRERLKRLFRKR